MIFSIRSHAGLDIHRDRLDASRAHLVGRIEPVSTTR